MKIFAHPESVFVNEHVYIVDWMCGDVLMIWILFHWEWHLHYLVGIFKIIMEVLKTHTVELQK